MEKKIDTFTIITYFFLSLSLVSTISYMIYTILNTSNLTDQLISIISVIILGIFSVLYVIMGLFIENKYAKILIIITSIILSFYSIFQIVTNINKIELIDFTNMDIKEVAKWAESKNIIIDTEYTYNDTIKQYKVIKQYIEPKKIIKKNTKVKVTVSNGPDPSINTNLDNLIGLKLDDVIKYIDDNHLTNVTINFEYNDKVPKDIIINQNKIEEITRNENVILTSSLGKKETLPSTKLNNLVGLDEFHLKVYLGRNNLKYNIVYEYDENTDQGYVIKQSIPKWTVLDPSDNKIITVTISEKNIITVPDLKSMTTSEVNTWATKNRIKIELIEKYDESIKKDNVISANYSKGTTINIGDTIEVIISKGQIKMIKFTDTDSFIDWANENNIQYDIEYKYNDLEPGKLINSTHKENQIIKNDDIVRLVISQGNNTTIPNLIGLSKEEAENKCKSKNIKCNFINDGTKVKEQSMKSNSTVPINTTITITME